MRATSDRDLGRPTRPEVALMSERAGTDQVEDVWYAEGGALATGGPKISALR